VSEKKSIIQLPAESSSGLYVAFKPTPERIAKGCYVTACARCKKLVGYWPWDSAGHEIICLSCANDIPAIRQHIDALAKERGE
jgi:hypothetical protein